MCVREWVCAYNAIKRGSPSFHTPPFFISKDADRRCCCLVAVTVIWHLPLENVFQIKGPVGQNRGKMGTGEFFCFSSQLMAVMKAVD